MNNQLLIGLLVTSLFLGCARPEVITTQQPTPHSSARLTAGTYNIRDYGATTTSSNNAAAIQNAINAASAAASSTQSSTVVVPDGSFVTGTIVMKSNVTLQIISGATLLGSTNLNDYPNPPKPANSPYTGNYALIFADNATNIAIKGSSTARTATIDGQGESSTFPHTINSGGRPRILFFTNCTNVSVSYVTLKNSAFYVQQYLGCYNVTVKGVNVNSLSNWNNDGLDMDAVGATISDCNIVSTDDGICLKSDLKDRPCKNVTVTNCTVASNTNGIKLGTSSYGGFQNINVSNCTVNKTPDNNYSSGHQLDGRNLNYYAFAAIAIENVDGGITDGVTITNTSIPDGAITPIFVKFGDRNTYPGTRSGVSVYGALRNVTIDGVTGKSVSWTSNSITGFPGYKVNGVTLKNINLTGPGGAPQAAVYKAVADSWGGSDGGVNGDYPESVMFGRANGSSGPFYLPAHGLYVRHAVNVVLSDCRFYNSSSDYRPTLWAEDATLDSDVLRGSTPNTAGDGYFIWLKSCHTSTKIRNSFCPTAAKVFVHVTGSDSDGITISGTNYQGGTATHYTTGSEVPSGTITYVP